VGVAREKGWGFHGRLNGRRREWIRKRGRAGKRKIEKEKK
jgi:hypothetical protein